VFADDRGGGGDPVEVADVHDDQVRVVLGAAAAMASRPVEAAATTAHSGASGWGELRACPTERFIEHVVT